MQNNHDNVSFFLQSLKLEALLFLRLSMEKHPPYVFHGSIRDTIKFVTPYVKEDWYKVM